MEILNIKDLTFTYPGENAPALSGIGFSLQKGEFLALCGATGSGKSTLLRMLKRELAPRGERSGSITLLGKNLENEDAPELAAKVGFVCQRPEQQLVTDKVWHEMAFGLENMGMPKNEMAKRVAEVASYFGIEHWFDKNVADLSGGGKQLLNLAAVMAMGPEVIILDEPTAQLDPIAASDFLATVRKLNRDLSLTVIICEHRLEEIVPYVDKMLALDAGKMAAFGTPSECFSKVRKIAPILKNMPVAARVYDKLADGLEQKVPFSIREGREFLERVFVPVGRSDSEEPHQGSDMPCAYALSSSQSKGSWKDPSAQPALVLKDLRFRYERNEPDILNGLNLKVYENEILCILGGNGSGKSTALLNAAGVLKPYFGKIEVFGKDIKKYKGESLYKDGLAMLPQDVQTILMHDSVSEELSAAGVSPEELPFDLTPFFTRHPYDLSGGEQQLVALAKVLASKPKLLLLDEPTKGLDAHYKEKITDIIKSLKRAGVTVLIVTHDVEFAAGAADRCCMFFRGDIVSEGTPREFFSGNMFYTTAASRMSRGLFENAVTDADVVECAKANAVKQ